MKRVKGHGMSRAPLCSRCTEKLWPERCGLTNLRKNGISPSFRQRKFIKADVATVPGCSSGRERSAGSALWHKP
jgi:hypothetical protein